MELDVIREKIEALTSEHHSYLLEFFIRSSVPYRVVDNAVYANISELSSEEVKKVAEYINEVHKTEAEARLRMSSNKTQKGYQVQSVPPPPKRKVSKVAVVSFKTRGGVQAATKVGLADYSDQQKELKRRLRARRVSHNRNRTTHAHAVKSFTSSTTHTLDEYPDGNVEPHGMEDADGDCDDTEELDLLEPPDETEPADAEHVEMVYVDAEPELEYLSPDESHPDPRDLDSNDARVRLPLSPGSTLEERLDFYRPVFEASGVIL